jgi:lysophospholipase L1-like esterase
VLPWRPPVRLLGIEGECRPPEPGMAPARRWLAYGSSITHGNQCIHPSGSYAMRAAQRAGADLINMGFGGGAHLEPEMADYIASRDDWDLATLEMGINILGLGVAEFAHRVEYFINTIAAAHPSKPVFGIDIFTSNEDFSGTGNTAAFRRTVRRLVRESGKANLFYLSGRHLLTTADGLTSDLVHPSPHGMEEIAERLARAVSGRLAALRFTPPQAG